MNLCHGLRILQNKERESKVPPLVPSRQKYVQLFTGIKILAALSSFVVRYMELGYIIDRQKLARTR